MPFQSMVSDLQQSIDSANEAYRNAYMPVDNSSGSYLSGISTVPVGDTYRGFGSSWFNQGAVANEDWRRDEQSAMNAWLRDMEQMRVSNEFNASEAQKQRDFEERMSNTAYQRAVEDMQVAGINPVLAYQQGGSSTPSGSSASSSAPSRSSASRSRGYDDPLNGLVSTAAKLIGVVIGGKISSASKLASALVSAQARSTKNSRK